MIQCLYAISIRIYVYIFDNKVIEYADGTPATQSQLAKDVATFLRWTSQPEFEDRKIVLIKTVGIMSFLIAFCYYLKRHKWSTLKTRKIFYAPKKN